MQKKWKQSACETGEQFLIGHKDLVDKFDDKL